MLLLLPLLLSAAFAAPGPGPRYSRDIRPILADACLNCHGPDSSHRKAGLRLDTSEGATTTNKAGRVAIHPGNLNASEIWRRLNSTDPEVVMPPPDAGKPLTDAHKQKLRQWIESGAPYEKHWALDAPIKAPLPNDPVANAPAAHGPANPIDRFLGLRRRRDNLHAAPPADPVTRIRRVTLDLTGLPPTPAEVDAFLSDPRPDAYGTLVDRLLNSPRYGEQMARPWLDVARYADTHGMHLDNERQIWPYRDWVVRSFNRNLPFDQFTIDQLAGDLIPEATLDQLTATGFNRCNVTSGEGGSIDAEYLFRYAVDRTSTVAQTWLGLTAGCAVCHDHKFDPISAREFYSLYAFFNRAGDPAMDGNTLRTAPALALPTPENEHKLAELDARIRSAEAQRTTTLAGLSYADPAGQIPRPPAEDKATVWFDDGLPSGLKSDTKPTWIEAAGGPVFAGKKALQRKGDGVVQDIFETTGEPFLVLPETRFSVQVYLDPAHPPRMIMLQWKRDDWAHRALWGDPEGVNWGERGTPTRAVIGPLPEAGKWVRLEVTAEQVGLHAGDQIRAFACTQTDGTVTWDQFSAHGRSDPTADPSRSFAAWQAAREGKSPGDLPENLRKIFKDTVPTNRSPAQAQQLRDHYLGYVHQGSRALMEPLNKAVVDLRNERNTYQEAIPHTLIWRDTDKPRDSFIMVRGQYDRPGEKVQPGVPAVLPRMQYSGTNATRLDLARWLVSPEQPLTARVTVNRFWQQFFGVGLVKTADDFGTQGQLPSHLELLDWLAVDFRESGWNVKRLVRLFVTSEAYQQSSHVTPELWQHDPENRLLARGPRFRLDAEQLRDQALFVAGLLDLTIGGRGVKPYQPPNIWEPVGFVGSNTRDYKQDTGSALYRRSLYTFFKRTAPPPFMAAFDAPNREQACTRRERSNTPLQALQLMNDVQYVEAARHLAQRMLTAGGTTPAQRLRFGFRSVIAREPDARELATLTTVLGEHQARYGRDPEAAQKLLAVGDSPANPALSPGELAAYTLTANLLLNLDETLTRN